MKRLFFLLIVCFWIVGCTYVPFPEQSGLTEEQLTQLTYPEALDLWKQSQIMTDGCSSPRYINWLVTILNVRNWEDCCFQHDFDYHYGYQYEITRETADNELFDCVRESGHPGTAIIMWSAVRVFGSSSYISNGEK